MQRAIASVIGQSYSNLECIIVDDGSSDNTKQIFNSINDNRLVYIEHDENMGASAARNTGIKHSRGDFIAFLDDDDEWIIDKLEKQVALLLKSTQNIGLIYSWMRYMKDEKELYESNPKLKGYIFNDMLDKQAIGNSSTLLVRRRVIDTIGGFDESLPRGNDGDFIRRVCRKYEVDFIPKVLVKVYIAHGKDRISDNDLEGIKKHIINSLVKIKKFQTVLDGLPKQRANIYFDLARSYTRLGDLYNTFYYYLKAFGSYPFSRKFLLPFIYDIRSLFLSQLK